MKGLTASSIWLQPAAITDITTLTLLYMDRTDLAVQTCTYSHWIGYNIYHRVTTVGHNSHKKFKNWKYNSSNTILKNCSIFSVEIRISLNSDDTAPHFDWDDSIHILSYFQGEKNRWTAPSHLRYRRQLLQPHEADKVYTIQYTQYSWLTFPSSYNWWDSPP